VIPTTWVARGGGHAGVRVFPALQRPKGYGIRCNMTRGREWSSPRDCGAWGVVEDGRRRGPAEGKLGCSRTARCGASPGLLVHQINTCRSCEGVKGVSGVGDAPAASNCAAACDLPAAEEKEAGGARGLSDG
jgi:hypothetical protein